MVKSGWVGKSIYIIVILSSISICFLGISLNASQKRQRTVEYAHGTIKNEAVKINQLYKKIRQFYQGDQEAFLAEPIDEGKLKDIERDILTLKTGAGDFGLESKEFSANTSGVTQGKKELLLKIEDIKKKQTTQKQLSTLLVQAPTDWNAEHLDVAINDKATEEEILKIRSEISNTESQWGKAITTVLNEMETQVQQYNNMEKSIAEMIQDRVLTSNANVEKFILIFNQLEQIKNEVLKKELSDKLDVIDALLEKQSAETVTEEQE